MVTCDVFLRKEREQIRVGLERRLLTIERLHALGWIWLFEWES